LPCDCEIPEDASWSPDGRRLVYVETEIYDPYAVGSLLITDVSAGRERMLTHAVFAAMYSLLGGAPAWSPDGKLIAFVQHPGPPVGRPYQPDLPRYRDPAKQRRIFVIAPRGGTARKLVDIEATHPSWSPDAKFIAFDDGHRIGIVGVNGGPVRFVATGTDPAWSPDGSTIAYVKGDNVWLVDLASGHARLVARHAWDPAWRPSP
jgi:Tol biopolymer transport system component